MTLFLFCMKYLVIFPEDGCKDAYMLGLLIMSEVTGLDNTIIPCKSRTELQKAARAAQAGSKVDFVAELSTAKKDFEREQMSYMMEQRAFTNETATLVLVKEIWSAEKYQAAILDLLDRQTAARVKYDRLRLAFNTKNADYQDKISVASTKVYLVKREATTESSVTTSTKRVKKAIDFGSGNKENGAVNASSSSSSLASTDAVDRILSGGIASV